MNMSTPNRRVQLWIFLGFFCGVIFFPLMSWAQINALGPELLYKVILQLQDEIKKDKELIELVKNRTALKTIRMKLEGRLPGKWSLLQALTNTYPEEMADVIFSLSTVLQQEEEIVNTALKSERIQRETRTTLVKNMAVKEEIIGKIEQFLGELGDSSAP